MNLARGAHVSTVTESTRQAKVEAISANECKGGCGNGCPCEDICEITEGHPKYNASVKCYRCGQYGHCARDCPMMSWPQGVQPDPEQVVTLSPSNQEYKQVC